MYQFDIRLGTGRPALLATCMAKSAIGPFQDQSKRKLSNLIIVRKPDPAAIRPIKSSHIFMQKALKSA